MRTSDLRLLGYCLQQSVADDLLASCYGTHFVETWTRVLPQGRSLLALDSQTDNIISLITLTKSIYTALTYTIYKFTIYGYEANKSISRDTDSDPDVGCRSFASSLFALFHCFFVYSFLLFFIFVFLFISFYICFISFLFYFLFYTFCSIFPSSCLLLLLFYLLTFKLLFHTFSFASCVPCSLFHDLNFR